MAPAEEMSEWQRHLWGRIQAEKKKTPQDKKEIRRLAHMMTAEDDRSAELNRGLKARFGTRGRSPSWGKWARDDE